MKAIVMVESYWANTHLSFVRHTGRVRIWGHEYVIVDKRGHDIFECSMEAEMAGRENAIEPGEPCDLCRVDFVPIYRKLGREKFLQFLQENPSYLNTVAMAKKRLALWEKGNKI